ncbi:N-acetyltransferase, partial [Bacillus cereus]|nr:N-acetyltransferase [Bacillus cereus]
TRAQALYKKAGFEKEGVKKAALIIDGKGIDEYEMAKLLK